MHALSTCAAPLFTGPDMRLLLGSTACRRDCGLQSAAVIASIVAIVALGLRLHGLGDKPLWLDEIITWQRASLPIPELIDNAIRNEHFPTYFLLVRLFDAPVIDEWMLRLPSAICGAISVSMAVLVAAEAQSLRAGVVAGALMALSPFEVQFAQEARPYTLLSCFVFLAIWGLVRIAQRPAAAAAPLGQRYALLGSWGAYTVGTIGALDTSAVTYPWLLVSNLALAVIIWRAGFERRGLLRNWLLVQFIILLVCLPGLIGIFSRSLETH